MRQATRVRTAPRGRRRGFTLIEMMVVIAIIAVLVTITVAAVMQVLTIQQKRATEATIQKITSVLDRHVKAVVETASKEQIPPAVVSLAGGDMPRARVIWTKLRMKQEFPTNYAEAHNPAPGYLSGKNVFKNLPAAANNPLTESSACLLIALSQGHGGEKWDPQQTLGASFVRDTDGDGALEFVDAWDTALYFVRWPTTNQDLNPGGIQPGALNDSQDPTGLLADAVWAPGGNGQTFSNLVGYPVLANKSFKNLNPFVASAGPNNKYGDGDDIFSYRLRSVGSKGD